MIHTLRIEKEYGGDPIKCQTKWTKKENNAWLQARGLVANQKKMQVKYHVRLPTFCYQEMYHALFSRVLYEYYVLTVK